MTDAMLELVDYVRKGLSTTTIATMVSVRGAFDYINKKKLVGVMRTMCLPETAVRWTFEFMKYRSASLV